MEYFIITLICFLGAAGVANFIVSFWDEKTLDEHKFKYFYDMTAKKQRRMITAKYISLFVFSLCITWSLIELFSFEWLPVFTAVFFTLYAIMSRKV